MEDGFAPDGLLHGRMRRRASRRRRVSRMRRSASSRCVA